MKQRFKGQVLSQKKCLSNILHYFSLATASELKDGMNWYKDANIYARELSQRFNITISQVIGIIAAFSPQAQWDTNKRYTITYLINPKAKIRSKVQHIKAAKILTLHSESEIYHALSTNNAAYKTKAFFLNILNPDIVTEVTIDRHAIAACIQKPDKTEALDESYGQLTKLQYDFMQQVYVKAANEIGILPQQLQAIVWVVYRRLRDLSKHDKTMHWQPFETSELF